MESSGALVRILQNALPAAIFLTFRKRFMMEGRDKRFWTWMAVIAFVFVGGYAVSPSSTVVDRLGLYWIPIQLVVFSRLPDALSFFGYKWFWSLSVVAYSGVTLFVWLFFASHVFAWLPYQFYPWVKLWL
jgi:hypothetical protein